ncbi:MAG: hypothetical protein ACYDBH_19160, partial [Acidobacteriaceae bacterium]
AAISCLPNPAKSTAQPKPMPLLGILQEAQMIVLLKESIDIKRTELADTKEEIRRLQGRTKEIEKSIKRFEKLMNAARP